MPRWQKRKNAMETPWNYMEFHEKFYGVYHMESRGVSTENVTFYPVEFYGI